MDFSFAQFATSQDLDFEAPFEMIVTKPGTVSGLVVSFDTGFFAKSDPPPPPTPPPTGSITETEKPASGPAAAAGGRNSSSDSSSVNANAGVKPEGGERGAQSGEEATATGAGTGAATIASWFSTGPESRPTHWKQTLLWLRPSEKPEGLAEGDAVAGRLSLHRNEVNPRELGLTVTWTATQQSTGRTFGGTQKYSVC